MFIAVVAGGLFISWLIRGEPPEVAAVGRQAPFFEVALLDGGTFDLSEQLELGKPVVVNLWASWCIPCRTEMPDLSAFAAAHPEVTMIGVAVEDRLEKARAFAAEISPVYPLAMGDPAFEDSYPRLGLPVTYVIDATGTVTAVHNGIIDFEALEELIQGVERGP
ncbi:MAG TPA: TlpA disulfide reductase family protein [Acidimicrobiia bacterium]